MVLQTRNRIPHAFVLLTASLLAAAVSVKTQGFRFAYNNNLFQIPIFEHWSSDPALAADPFIGSLQYYVSGVWGILGRVKIPGDTESAFWLFHFLARWATLFTLCLVAGNLGIRRLVAQCSLAFWFGLIPSLRGVTSVGSGDLFQEYFTHTELTIPVVLLAILMMARDRVVWAFALTGILLDINIFVGVWTGCALAAAAFWVKRPDGGRKKMLVRAARGIGCAWVLALPVLYWTIATLRGQPAYAPFDYVEFLEIYYPNHFLIQAASPFNVLLLAAVVASAGWAFGLLKASESTLWRAAFLGFGLVFTAGIVLPGLTHRPMLLNLHLLRVDGVLIMLAIVLLSILAAHKLSSPTDGERIAGFFALLLLSLPNPAGIVFAAILLLATRVHDSSATRRWSWILACLVTAALGISTFKNQSILEGILVAGFLAAQPMSWRLRAPSPVVLASLVGFGVLAYAAHTEIDRHSGKERLMESAATSVQEAGRWAKVHTTRSSIFLVPAHFETSQPSAAEKARQDIDSQADMFGLWARRKVWVNWKSGAAVMWSPSYYWTWRGRLEEVSGLNDLTSQIKYACHNDIDYVVTSDVKKREYVGRAVYQNSRLLIVEVPKSCH